MPVPHAKITTHTKTYHNAILARRATSAVFVCLSISDTTLSASAGSVCLLCVMLDQTLFAGRLNLWRHVWRSTGETAFVFRSFCISLIRIDGEALVALQETTSTTRTTPMPMPMNVLPSHRVNSIARWLRPSATAAAAAVLTSSSASSSAAVSWAGDDYDNDNDNCVMLEETFDGDVTNIVAQLQRQRRQRRLSQPEQRRRRQQRTLCIDVVSLDSVNLQNIRHAHSNSDRPASSTPQSFYHRSEH